MLPGRRARALVALAILALPLFGSVPESGAVEVTLRGPPALATFDSDGDGRDDAAHVTQVVHASEGTITATLAGHLFPPGANPDTSWSGWVDAAFDTQTIACGSAGGCNQTFSLDLRARPSGPAGEYTAVLNLTTMETMTETIATGTKVTGSFPADIETADGVVIQYQESTERVEAEIAYRSNSGASASSSPKTRTWDGAALGGETEQATGGSAIRAVRIAWSPTMSNSRITVTQGDDGWLDAYVCTPACAVTNNIGQVWSNPPPNTPEKRFDIAYESVSGEALLVYAVLSGDPTRDIAYRTFAGGAWSAELYLDDVVDATDVQYSLVNLASRKGTDQVGLVAAEATNNDANAWIWDGTSFGFATEITATAENPSRERVAIRWESRSGHLIALTVEAGGSNIVSKEFTTAWGPATMFPCSSGPARWLSLNPNPAPTADDMVLAVGDSTSALNTCYWSGTAWALSTVHDSSIDSATTRPFGFAWEGSGGKGLLVWGTAAGQLTYRDFTAPSTWGTIANVFMGANIHPWVELRTNPFSKPGSTRILGVVMEAAANNLGAVRWNGSALTVIGSSTLTADVGTTAYDSFGLEYRAVDNDQLSVRYDWTGVPTGDSHALQMRAYRDDEDINVQVLTSPSTWNTRLTIAATTSTVYTYTLTPAEYAGGSPSIQLVDARGAGGRQSDVWIDWVTIASNATGSAGRVVSASLRLEPSGSGPSTPPGLDGGVAMAAGGAIGVAAVAGPLFVLWFFRRAKKDPVKAGSAAAAPLFGLRFLRRPKKVEIKAGKGYFAETFQREAALQVVAPFVQRGYATLVISRVHPDEVKSMLPFEGAHPLWLVDYSEQTSKKVDAVPPSLEKLYLRTSTFMESALRTAVVIDGLEFLIDNSNFSSVMRFLRRLIDIVAQRDCLLLVTAAPDALGAKERSNLERELTRVPM